MLDLTGLAGRGDTNVLSGKQRGEQVRVDLRLDGLDDAQDDIKVVLPEGVEAVTPSFVLGLFGRSVRKFGSVDAFFRKYRFDNAKPHVVAQLRRGAQYSLVTGTPVSF